MESTSVSYLFQTQTFDQADKEHSLHTQQQKQTTVGKGVQIQNLDFCVE